MILPSACEGSQCNSGRVCACKLTVLSLKVSMTRSPPSREAKAISKMRKGFDLTMRQLTTSPPMGVIALSISAGVVPGAKFCAMTVNGPARPLIVMPIELLALFAFGFTMLTCWGASTEVSMRSTAADRRATRRLLALLLAELGAEMRALKSPEIEWCRS